MFVKTHGIIDLDLAGTQDMPIFRASTVRLNCTFAEPLEESIALFLLNQVFGKLPLMEVFY